MNGDYIPGLNEEHANTPYATVSKKEWVMLGN